MNPDLDIFLATMVGQSVSVPTERVAQLLQEHYALDATVERLTGERDENFHVATAAGSAFVFKVANAAEDPVVTDLATAALLHVEQRRPELPCPRVCRDLRGSSRIQFRDAAGCGRVGRLVTYLQGRPLRFAARSHAQRVACGRLLAHIGQALRDFQHPASHRALAWDLVNLPRLGRLLRELPGLPQTAFIGKFVDSFTKRILPRLARCRRQFVHNDFNDRNVLVAPLDDAAIAGVIDFGDAVHTALIADVAIAAVAHLANPETLQESITDLVRAYHEVEPLTAAELEILHWLIAARIVMGVVIPTWHRAKNPGANHFEAFDADHIDRRIALARRLMAANPPAL